MSEPAFSGQIPTRVDRQVEELLAPGGAWDDLVSRGDVYPLFLRSGWMRGSLAAYGHASDVVAVMHEDRGRLIAGGLFVVRDGVGEFLGRGPCDYLGIVVDADVADATRERLREEIVAALLNAEGGPQIVHLTNLCREGAGMERSPSGAAVHFVRRRSTVAPTLELASASKVLGSKSVKRCENRLARQGTVRCETYERAEAILPRLDTFFEQHVRRWHGTPFPSLFQQEGHRTFFRKLTEELDSTGVLRFTELRLDETLVAAHFGFFDGGRWVWYKPSYEPSMAELSPGVVLISRLVRAALEAGAEELDFTIGDEAFKSRYATREREVVDLVATRSASYAWRLRTGLSLKRGATRLLRKTGMLETVRRLWPRSS